MNLLCTISLAVLENCYIYGVERVFEISPLFRHEKSNSKIHMCEFVDLGAEKEMK